MVAGEQRETPWIQRQDSPALAAKTSFNNRCCTAERRPEGTAICSPLFVALLPAPDDLLSDDLLPVDLLLLLRDFDAMVEKRPAY
jgi:hypothetical protein